MADRVIFTGWTRPVVGREKQAMQLFQKATAYYSKLKTEGKIESFEQVLLMPHGGDLNGFTLIRGDAKKLAEIQDEATAVELRMEAAYCLEGYGVIVGYTGEGLTNLFPQWLKLIGS
jgi:hypothetical protein